jgi:hypothetical protein
MVDQATAAETIEELQAEIVILRPRGAGRAGARSRQRPQVGELSRSCCRTSREMFDATEPAPQAHHLHRAPRHPELPARPHPRLLGRPRRWSRSTAASNRDERRRRRRVPQDNPDVQVLVATDAAGEGINLQRAHLMVNYDLPWNPNRWSSASAASTASARPRSATSGTSSPTRRAKARSSSDAARQARDERKALGGQVFDVLGVAVPFARHLDLVPITASQSQQVGDVLQAAWVTDAIEARALAYAVEKLVPDHTQEVAGRRQRQADKQLAAVRERLVKEIQYWSDRAIKLDLDVKAGRQPRLQPDNARRRAEELSARLKQRTAELQAMRQVVSGSPNVIGGALVIPAGLLALRNGLPNWTADAEARARVERLAMQAVFDAEQALGHRTKDVSADKCGWDITVYIDQPQGLALERHIEVKGRAKGQDTITVTSNEIRHGLNQKDKFVLAVAVVDGEAVEALHYIPMPFTQEPDWAEASKNLDLGLLISNALSPGDFHHAP